jgi:hypothetical protein
MKRTDIINLLIQKYGYKSYLEVGTQDPTSNFDLIQAETKVSIDPFPRGEVTFVGTSDEYFDSIDNTTQYDIIFIDGLHHDDQVLKDINNSLNHLSDNGSIVIHDCLPMTERMQEREDHGEEWTGDVWKAIAELRVESIDLDIKVVDTDYGCGIIRRGTNIPYQTNEVYKTFGYYVTNRNQLMNIISIEQFIEMLNETK